MTLPSNKGGSGSGNFGHEGRPGEQGGSGEGGGGITATRDQFIRTTIPLRKRAVFGDHVAVYHDGKIRLGVLYGMHENGNVVVKLDDGTEVNQPRDDIRMIQGGYRQRDTDKTLLLYKSEIISADDFSLDREEEDSYFIDKIYTPSVKEQLIREAAKHKAMTAEHKQLLWKKYNAEATSYEPLFKRVAVKFFRDTCAKIINKLEANGVKIKSNLGAMNINSRQKWLAEHKDRLDEFLPKLSGLKSELKDALKPVLMSVLKSAAQNQIKDISAMLPARKNTKSEDIESDVEVEFDLNDPRVIKWIGDRLDDTSETTAQTTIDATRKTLREDFENGEPLLKISTDLREHFTAAETWRANLIAKTEATAATSQAGIEAVEQMDLGDNVGKFWLTENDPKVRDTHQAAGERYSDGYDGNTDNIMGPDDEFVVGSDKMVSPGNGSEADEVCNCRCGVDGPL